MSTPIPLSRSTTGTSAARSRAGSYRRRTAGVVASIVLAAASWGVATGPLGVRLTVGGSGGAPSDVGLGAVLVASLLVAVGAWLVAVALERLAPRRARLPWLLAAGAVLLVSLLGPLTATTAAATVSLLVLHLVVGGCCIGLIAPAHSAIPRNYRG